MTKKIEKPKKIPPKLIGFVETVVKIGETQGHPKRWTRHLYKYECICGNTFITEKYKVDSGRTTSCGCFRKKMSSYNAKIHNMKQAQEELSKLKLEEFRKKLRKTGLRKTIKI